MRIYRGPALGVLALPLLLLLLTGCDRAEQMGQDAAEPNELVVYSSRKEHLIKPLFEQFTKETGIGLRYVTDKDGPLLARLAAEGERSPADVLMTVDAGNLWHAAEIGLLATSASEVLQRNVPANFRDKAGRWYGLSLRARTLVVQDDLPADFPASYEDLGDPRLKGQLCLRTAKKVYNQSLVASLIAVKGEEKTEVLVKSWVANLATEPFSNDTRVLEAIDAGVCKVGVVNSYYLARYLAAQPESRVAIRWANQAAGQRGVHVNVSGAGVTSASRRPQLALQLLEWLSERGAQQQFAAVNQEFPANRSIPVSPALQSWGDFRADDLPVSELGRLQAAAVRLMDRAGYR